MLFAADEPVDLDGTDPATILLRRTKQNIAEYFRLSLKQKMWCGLRTHAAQGYNLGKVLDGYLPEKIPHPAPSKASQGRTKTLLVLDEQRAPIIAAIYAMRAEEKLGVRPSTPGCPPTRPPTRPPTPRPAGRSAACTRSWPTRNTPGTRCSAGPAKASPSRPASGTGRTSAPTPPSWTARSGKPPRR